jgi:hypothetical protein
MRLTQRLKPKARAARQRVVCWCWERCRVLSQHTTADVCGKLAELPPLLQLHHMLLPPKAKVAAPQRPALHLHRAPKWVSCRGVWVTPTSHIPPTPHGLLLRCSAVLLLYTKACSVAAPNCVRGTTSQPLTCSAPGLRCCSMLCAACLSCGSTRCSASSHAAAATVSARLAGTRLGVTHDGGAALIHLQRGHAVS